jgi:hypothetical protein
MFSGVAAGGFRTPSSSTNAAANGKHDEADDAIVGLSANQEFVRKWVRHIERYSSYCRFATQP